MTSTWMWLDSTGHAFRQDAAAQFVTVAWQQSFAQKQPEQPKSCPVCHQTYQPQGDSSEEYVTKPPKNLGDNFWLKKGTFQDRSRTVTRSVSPVTTRTREFHPRLRGLQRLPQALATPSRS